MAGTMKVKATGSRAMVFHGTAKHTAGGLKKSDLMMRKGRIVSKKASAAGKKAIKRLRAMGYIAKKGKFTLFKKMTKKGKKGSRKMRGGNFFMEESGSSGSQ
jgi:hypothetical protein